MTCLEALIECVSESGSFDLHEKHRLRNFIDYLQDSIYSDAVLECPIEKQYPIIDGGSCCDECGFNMEED